MFDLPTGDDGGYNVMAEENAQPEFEASPLIMPETVHEKEELDGDEEEEGKSSDSYPSLFFSLFFFQKKMKKKKLLF